MRRREKKDGSTTEDPAGLYLAVTASLRRRIVTDLAVMDVTPDGLQVVALADGVTREELQSKTGVVLRF